MSDTKRIIHTIPPVFDANSRILILGSIPSPKSRESGFYYGHPQNRFWPVLAALWKVQTPMGADERRKFALQHKIALWDVLASCDIAGASDTSIRNPIANDIGALLQKTSVRYIFTTGQAAHKYYNALVLPKVDHSAIALPSTSPANCRMKFDELCQRYQILHQKLHGEWEE